MQLLKGTYSKEDATEIVQKILEVKTRFYETQIRESVKEEELRKNTQKIKELQDEFLILGKAIRANDGPVRLDAFLNLDGSGDGTHNFSLIKGAFDYEDACEILLNAYRTKINFHKLKAFVKTERGEKGVEVHQQRALELQSESDKIAELLQTDQKQVKKVNITCSISMHFEPDDVVRVSEPGFDVHFL